MKTYNRIPVSVSVPTTSQLAIKYFNYTSWKGKCTDKNYIGVDQETFEDCKNVYIDEDNVLRSRPSIKVAKDKIHMSVDKIYTFGPWTVYKRASSGNTTSLDFVYGNQSWALTDVPKDCNIVLANEKIFVFGNNYAKYFDLINTEMLDATDLIYSPVTKLYTYGTESNLEENNVWSKTHRERYIWSRKSPTNLDKLTAKKVTVNFEGEEPTVINKFQKYQEYTIAKKMQSLDSNSVLNYSTFTLPLVDVSKKNSVVYAVKETKTVNAVDYTYYTVYYSVDGITFNVLDQLPWINDKPYNCYYKPRFSDDGTIVYIYTSAGLYAISVLSDSPNSGYRYNGWTNVTTAFNFPTDIVYSQYGSAHMANYNTFSVYPDTTKTTAYLVQSGTLSAKATVTKPTESASYTAILSSDYMTILAIVSQNGLSFLKIMAENDEPVIVNEELSLGANIDSCLTRVILYRDVYCNALYQTPYTSPRKLVLHTFINQTTTRTQTLHTSLYFSVPIAGENSQSWMSSDSYTYAQETVRIDACIPVTVRNTGLYYLKPNGSNYDLYTSYTNDNIYFTETVIDKFTIDYRFDYEAELFQYYISKGKTVYISSSGSYPAHEFEWYFPEVFAQHFDYEITGLHPISTTEVTAFTQNSIYYIVPTTITRDGLEQKAFAYYKSRIPLGCEKGCEIVTSYDGKYTIFPTKRGLVAMAYQDFVSSNEQALTFLSDNIADEFFKWNQGEVKITLYKYWAVIYRLDTPIAYVLDMRNMSWWTMEYATVQQVVEMNKKLYVLSNNILYVLNTDETDYRDDIGKIEWSLTSQKLHFGAVNYYKQIQNLTLSAVSQIDAIEDPIAYSLGVNGKLDITNYRKTLSGETDQSIHYQVNLTRTYVARLNYLKVNEFQFTIRSYENQASQLPLMLTNIAIKFKITGQVR